MWKAFGSLDSREAARAVEAPTLILHSTDDRVWSFDEATELHSMIQGSTLVPLPSRNHILVPGEPAFAQMMEHVEEFLAS